MGCPPAEWRQSQLAAILSALVSASPGKHRQYHWAQFQADLGVAVASLGELENSAARLELATVALRAALNEHTRGHAPRESAFVQRLLSNVIEHLGAHGFRP